MFSQFVCLILSYVVRIPRVLRNFGLVGLKESVDIQTTLQ